MSQEEKIANFVDVTGSTDERARFYLEASNWELPTALTSFFEHDGDGVPEEMATASGMREDSDDGEEDANSKARIQQGLNSFLAAMGGGGQSGPVGSSSSSQAANSQRQPARNPGGMMTMDSLRSRASEDESPDEDGQAFYAGGSNASGQQILGPPKKREEFVAEMFRRAREHGAEEMEPTQSFAVKKKGGSFGGTGYKLGETESDSVAVREEGAASAEAQPVVLQLWGNGFTVNSGELRSYTDPMNLAFLESVKRGEVPVELIRQFRGQQLSLTMEDHRHEDYVPPRSARTFAGQGQMLGSPAPATIGGTAANLSEADRKANENAARERIPLAPGAPTTNIRFQLIDGSRLTGQFNHTHTIEDLHAFINTARPQYSAANYLLAMFPNLELADRNQNLKEANVLNSTIIQKLKQ